MAISFYDYMKQFVGVGDPWGDLAGDMSLDDRFPVFETDYSKLRKYLIQDREACHEALIVFDECYEDYCSKHWGVDIEDYKFVSDIPGFEEYLKENDECVYINPEKKVLPTYIYLDEDSVDKFYEMGHNGDFYVFCAGCLLWFQESLLLVKYKPASKTIESVQIMEVTDNNLEAAKFFLEHGKIPDWHKIENRTSNVLSYFEELAGLDIRFSDYPEVGFGEVLLTGEKMRLSDFSGCSDPSQIIYDFSESIPEILPSDTVCEIVNFSNDHERAAIIHPEGGSPQILVSCSYDGIYFVDLTEKNLELVMRMFNEDKNFETDELDYRSLSAINAVGKVLASIGACFIG